MDQKSKFKKTKVLRLLIENKLFRTESYTINIKKRIRFCFFLNKL